MYTGHETDRLGHLYDTSMHPYLSTYLPTYQEKAKGYRQHEEAVGSDVGVDGTQDGGVDNGTGQGVVGGGTVDEGATCLVDVV